MQVRINKWVYFWTQLIKSNLKLVSPSLLHDQHALRVELVHQSPEVTNLQIDFFAYAHQLLVVEDRRTTVLSFRPKTVHIHFCLSRDRQHWHVVWIHEPIFPSFADSWLSWDGHLILLTSKASSWRSSVHPHLKIASFEDGLLHELHHVQSVFSGDDGPQLHLSPRLTQSD